MADREISIIIKSDAQRAQAGIKNFGMSLTDLKSGIDLAMGAARQFAQAAQAAFDLGKEGATIAAITDRFAAFTGSTKEAERWLGELRTATNDTVSDLELMASATNLVSMGLASNSTEAANMAKMALMLGNQTMSAGDRINDFALMMANQAMPRLDAFGISSGKVRERIKELMATIPGITRETAFMRAAMEEGTVAMDKLGGELDGDITSYQRLEAASKNLTDALKENVGEGLAPLVETLAQGIIHGNELNAQAERGVALFGDRYTIAMQNAQRGVRAAGEEWMAYNRILDAVDEGNAAVAQGFSDVGASAPAARQAIEDAGAAAADAAIAYMNAAAGLGEMATAAFVNAQLEALRVALEGTEDGAQQLALATEALLVKFGLLTPAEQSASSTLDALRQMALDGTLTWDAYAAAVAGVKGSLDTLESKEITIGVKFDMQDLVLPGGGPGSMPWTPVATPMAGGGDFLATTPTHLLVGEAGAEHVTVTPVSQTNNDVNINFYNTPDPTQNVAALRALWGG